MSAQGPEHGYCDEPESRRTVFCGGCEQWVCSWCATHIPHAASRTPAAGLDRPADKARALMFTLERYFEVLATEPGKAGPITIVVGRHDDGSPVNVAQVALDFATRWGEAFDEISAMNWAQSLNAPRLAAVVDLRYALGREQFQACTRFRGNLALGEFEIAAHALMHHDRPPMLREHLERDAHMIRTGEW
jgi:hypothetical protein